MKVLRPTFHKNGHEGRTPHENKHFKGYNREAKSSRVE